MSNLREHLVVENQIRSNRCWTRVRSMMKLFCHCVPASGDGSEALTYGQALGMARRGSDDSGTDNHRPTGALTFEEVGAVWYVMPPLLCGTIPKPVAEQRPQ
mmetsp:Transcript_3963/g.5571  ORF Transcript_3963/g.5571 Transcript_3963/m.5571 type:complete len:102 (+) Transcript_3963:65-370(+)